MENHSPYGSSHINHRSTCFRKMSASVRTIEDVCAINGHRGREVPALRHDLVPNFSEIQKVYDTFFAPGLDCLIESGPSRWFGTKGFHLLTSDRSLLAQFMLYLTLISNTINGDLNMSGTISMPAQQAELASQEARMVWVLLNLIVRQAQEGINDEDVDKLARRVKALEALLTSEPVVRTGSMSDFLYQDPEPEPSPMDIDVSQVPTVANNPLLEKPFNKQLVARMEEFWHLVERASEQPTKISTEIFDRLRQLRDGIEQRDIVYSIMLLGASPKPRNDGRPQTSSGHSNSGRHEADVSPSRLAREQERRQAERLLESEARGRATNTVLQNIAGMGLRAFCNE
ncbi:hypothetical protein LTR05_001127 [Lithohypha guttulata]|uniref:Uncharacterized protein n=1 Tax=Lithohypha guttulata TaxID=1690604 RepID=A0AAN7T749_9EURO|nr:hypothetical protein LTR05_001127 [Lithohypha guttulata]